MLSAGTARASVSTIAYRDYGLFAANPFGQHDFEPKSTPANAGAYTIPAGGTLTLRNRVFLHSGDEREADLAARYAVYAKQPRPQ